MGLASILPRLQDHQWLRLCGEGRDMAPEQHYRPQVHCAFSCTFHFQRHAHEHELQSCPSRATLIGLDLDRDLPLGKASQATTKKKTEAGMFLLGWEQHQHRL